MDNLFELLIYLIIIISFLSSIFRKKKPQNPPQEAEQQPEVKPQSAAASSGSATEEDYDIVKEIEKLFQMDTREEPYNPAKVEHTPPASRRTTIEAKKEEQEARRSTLKSPEISKWESEKRKLEERKKKIDSSVEAQAKKFEDMLTRKREAGALELKNIRTKLKQKQSFREFIIVSEILGKPKALRR